MKCDHCEKEKASLVSVTDNVDYHDGMYCEDCLLLMGLSTSYYERNCRGCSYFLDKSGGQDHGGGCVEIWDGLCCRFPARVMIEYADEYWCGEWRKQ